MGRVFALTLLAMAVAPLYATPQHVTPRRTHPTAKKTSTAATKMPVSKRSSAHTPATSAHLLTAARTTHASSASTSTRTVRTRSGKLIRVTRAAPAPTYQLHPDPERYVEIQKALTDRGYFKGEPNGEWNDDSVDAMRRFQADQKIDNDGKIDALSLISLGLGPKHDGTSALSTAAPPVIQPLVPTSVQPSVQSPAQASVPPSSPAAVTNPQPR